MKYVKGLRPHPHLDEINTRVWLNSLHQKYSRQVKLSNIPDAEWIYLKNFYHQNAAGYFLSLNLRTIWHRKQEDRGNRVGKYR